MKTTHTLIAAAMAATLIPAALSSAAAIVAFDTNVTTSPFHNSAINGATTGSSDNATSLTGSLTDAAVGGGTTFSVTFDTPLTGVNVTTPTAPTFTSAVASFFGAEGTGMGVGEATLGRFQRGESFTLAATHKMAINSLLFHEWNGDESLHISWTSGGVAQSNVYPINTGSGVSALYTFPISGLVADANTDIVFTNVSPASPTANDNGRLRFRQISVSAVVPEPSTAVVVMSVVVPMLLRRRASV